MLCRLQLFKGLWGWAPHELKICVVSASASPYNHINEVNQSDQCWSQLVLTKKSQSWLAWVNDKTKTFGSWIHGIQNAFRRISSVTIFLYCCINIYLSNYLYFKIQFVQAVFGLVFFVFFFALTCVSVCLLLPQGGTQERASQWLIQWYRVTKTVLFFLILLFNYSQFNRPIANRPWI